MKKFTIILLILSFILSVNQASAQGVLFKEWQDGTPFFTHIDSAQNVLVDSVITLMPYNGIASQDSNFQFTLEGTDWSWPDNLGFVSAEDIDYRYFLGSYLYLVTDAIGNRVIEVDPNSSPPQIVWEFFGAHGTPKYLEKPVDAFIYLDNSIRKVLITDQGRHRVLKVIKENQAIEWQYGDETDGNGFNQLSHPTDAVPIPDSGRVFICDKGNNRVILVRESDKAIEWSWGLGELNNPVDIEFDSATQELLITDQGNHRVIIVNKLTNAISWQFGEKGVPDSLNRGLNLPTDADFLPNGNILICDGENKRLIEVNRFNEVVWQFSRQLENLKDADRLPDNKTLVVLGNLPVRLGYASTTAATDFKSEKLDIGQEVIFNKLYWEADTIANITSIKLQLRTENSLPALESAPWRGPTAQDSFYTHPGTPINPAHNGHRFYQIKARLVTNDALYTPVLKDVLLSYKYYDTNATGKIVTTTIMDSVNYIITRWKTLKLNTLLPDDPAARDKIELKITIRDANTYESLEPFTASKVDSVNEFPLSHIEELKQKQAIKLEATFKTNNSSVSPALDSWALKWEHVYSTPSQINFVDQDFNPVSHYRLSTSYQPGQPYIDRIKVLLKDLNLEQVQDAITLDINALVSLDKISVNLNLQPNGGYLLHPSIPGIIIDNSLPDVNNGFLEVFDRDTLVISYTDPTNIDDQSSDSVLIIMDTEGTIQFINQYADTIYSASIGDSIFVEILGEQDQDITPAQDTVSIIVFDHETSDEETLILTELADSTNHYSTGHFRSTTGLPLVLNNVRKDGDGVLQTIAGSIIGIRYFDTISEVPILQIAAGAAPPDTLWNPGGGPLDFDMAPNPFYANRHNMLRIRASSSIGDLIVEKIEVYSLAGEKITTIDGNQLTFYYNYPIPIDQFGFADNWWNLKSKSGTTVSSGTYFVKLYGKIVDSNKMLTKIEKLVIIR